MATAAQLGELISELTGVPHSMTATIMRRLGEADILPRGQKGRPAPDIDAGDVASAVLGVMAVCDGVAGTSVRVPQAVIRLGELRCKDVGPLVLNFKVHKFVPGETFHDFLSRVFEKKSETRPPMPDIQCVGVTSAGEKVCTWVEVKTSNPRHPVQRTVFGPQVGPGLHREARLSIDVLTELGRRVWREAPVDDRPDAHHKAHNADTDS